MMAGNPSWWSMLHPPPPSSSSSSSSSIFPSQLVLEYSSSLLPHELNSFPSDQRNLDPPQSWSQLLMGGLPREDQENYESTLNHLPSNRLGNWEDQHHHNQVFIPQLYPSVDLVVEENNNTIKLEINSHNNHDDGGHEDQFAYSNRPSWSEVQINNMPPVSSPRSCVTSLSSNIMLDFSFNHNKNQADHSSECNSPRENGICKKARVQPSSSQPPLKVRKEKLGDRITTLHQIVSPFGRTGTASVLLEAIGYIRFLQSQIEALSSPYLGNNASKNIRNNPQSLLNDNFSQKRKGSPNQGRDYDKEHNTAKDLRSKGLCLVPVSCTHNVGGDVNIGADYWAPVYGSRNLI